MAKSKKFKAIEKAAKMPTTGVFTGAKEEKKDIVWEGEELSAQSETKITEDKGTGQSVILRFFDFAADPVKFKEHKPTAQELFASHIKGIHALLWRDGLRPFEAVQPRLLFSKDKKNYRFIIPCVAGISGLIDGTPRTLSQLLQ